MTSPWTKPLDGITAEDLEKQDLLIRAFETIKALDFALTSTKVPTNTGKISWLLAAAVFVAKSTAIKELSNMDLKAILQRLFDDAWPVGLELASIAEKLKEISDAPRP